MPDDARDPDPPLRPSAPAAMSAPAPSLFAAGLAALRQFWRPFLLIQSAAIIVGLAYRFSDGMRAACVVLARWKVAGGFPFSAVTGTIAGGLVP